MKLTIIPIDGKVKIDGVGFERIDLTSCSIPEDVHALQWQESSGWIEYTSPLIANESITSLPDWANACISAYEQQFEVEKQKELEKYLSSNLTNNRLITLSEGEKYNIFIEDRNLRLQASDWTQLPDVKASHDQSWNDAWTTYRQELRDLPTKVTDLHNIFYPVQPKG
jgi:hypothetical protein